MKSVLSIAIAMILALVFVGPVSAASPRADQTGGHCEYVADPDDWFVFTDSNGDSRIVFNHVIKCKGGQGQITPGPTIVQPEFSCDPRYRQCRNEALSNFFQTLDRAQLDADLAQCRVFLELCESGSNGGFPGLGG